MTTISDAARPLFARAAMARRAGNGAEVEAAYRQWLALEPANPLPRYGLAGELLTQGRFVEAWPLYEARTEIPETGVRKPPLPLPEWRGQAIRSLLVWPEQGFGDQIMFARFIRPLVADGVEVTLVTPPPLVRLFGALGCQIIANDGGEMRLPRCDAWRLIGSLPGHVGGLPTDPYLPSRPGGEGVGVMTAGNPQHVNDANRSLTPSEAADVLKLGRDLAPDATGARDFQDTADIVAGLERVISVDTSVAHLAGAMGKPVEVLLRDPDWRWGRHETRSTWYPSARLVRRPAR